MRNKKRCYLMLAVLLAAVVFACAACAESPSEEQNNINEETEPQETIEITLPGSLFEFANTDLQDNLDQVEAENSEYSCELSSEYSKVVYKYDENIDGILQAKILVSLTSIYVMNGIIETNNSDWSVDASIVNCHTGKTVVQGTSEMGMLLSSAKGYRKNSSAGDIPGRIPYFRGSGVEGKLRIKHSIKSRMAENEKNSGNITYGSYDAYSMST